MKNSKYKAVLFDFDYTLVDSSLAICDCFVYALSKMGYEIPADQEICKNIGLPVADMFYNITSNDNSEDAVIFRKFFKEQADKVMTAKTILFEDVISTVDFLHNKGIKCGIVSTKNRSRIMELLDRDNLADRFDIIIGGEDVNTFKPDPEGVFKAIERLSITNEQCLYVGDSITDSKTARNANVDFIGVLTGTTSREQMEFYPNVKIIPKLTDLKLFV